MYEEYNITLFNNLKNIYIFCRTKSKAHIFFAQGIERQGQTTKTGQPNKEKP